MDLKEYNEVCEEVRTYKSVLGVAMRHCKPCNYDIYQLLKKADERLEKALNRWKNGGVTCEKDT